MAEIEVKGARSLRKLDTFSGVMAEGSQEDILRYLGGRNVFDAGVFGAGEILWMLRDRDRYGKILGVLRARGYVD